MKSEAFEVPRYRGAWEGARSGFVNGMHAIETMQ